MDLCEEYKLPRIIFVTNMDDDHASFRELILKLEKKFGRKIAPFQVPIRENEKFVGFVNAVKMQAAALRTCPIMRTARSRSTQRKTSELSVTP